MTLEEAKEAIKEAYGNSEYTDEIIKALEQEPKIWSLDNAREDFMHDVYNTLDFLPTNNEANRIIDSFDRVTSSIEQQSEDCISRTEALKVIEEQKKGFYGVERYAIDECHSAVMKLPSVTPQQKLGKWIKIEPYPLQMNEYECSECGHETNDNTESYCSECGAKMEVEK